MSEAVIYCRISVADRTGNSYSLDNQYNICNEYCKTNNIGVKRVVYETISARNMKNLDTLNQLIDEITPNTLIVVSSVSRFGRNVLKALLLLEKMEEKKISIHCVNENIGYKLISDRFTFRTLLNLAEFESDQISDRIQTSIKIRKDNDNVIGRPKFGYEIYYSDRIRKMRKNISEYEIIITILEYNCNGIPHNEIANMLNEKGKTHRGTLWTHQKISKIINLNKTPEQPNKKRKII